MFMPFRPVIPSSILVLYLLLSSPSLLAASLEGDIAFGGSYNTNAGLLSSDELAATDRSARSNRAFGADLDAILTLSLGDLFAMEYSLFTTVTPTDITSSFWYHSLAFSFSHELKEVDIEYGIEVGHLMIGFENRTVDPQLFFNLFWYADDHLSYYLTSAFSYVAALSDTYDYFNAPGGRLETGIYVYPVAGNRSFISLGLGERLFFFGEEYVASEDGLPPVWSQHGFSETYARLKGKFIYEGFSAEASARYGFSYYLDDDRWTSRGSTYTKRRIDHGLRIKATLEYCFTDFFSLLGYYQYQRLFSSIGTTPTDYRDLSYDQHLAGAMVRFVF